METKAYPGGNLHAKVYRIRFGEGDRDFGRVINLFTYRWTWMDQFFEPLLIRPDMRN